MSDIFVSTFPFAREDQQPLRDLQASGFTFTLNPLSRKLTPDELSELAGQSRVLVAGTEDVKPLILGSEKVKLIARVGIGLDSVPLELCRERGIRVAYTPHAVTPAVAELAIGLMVDTTRRITFSDRELRTGGWTRPYGRRLGDSTVGLAGFGKIGVAVARLLVAFKPKEILVYDKRDRSDALAEFPGAPIRQAPLDELLTQSDVLSLHIPLTRLTRGMIDLAAMKKMKPTAAVINTSRGGVIDEKDLHYALKNGILAGAAIDVFDREPYRGELINLENIVLTQHIASCAFDCRAQMELEAVHDGLRFLRGESMENEVPDEEYLYQAE